MKRHLQDLRRISPCCGSDIEHSHPFHSRTDEMAVAIKCVKCGKRVLEHRLINGDGQIVWPPPRQWVLLIPVEPKRKRCRKKVLVDYEPEPYRIIFEGD